MSKDDKYIIPNRERHPEVDELFKRATSEWSPIEYGLTRRAAGSCSRLQPTQDQLLRQVGYARVGQVTGDRATLDVIAAIARMAGVEVKVLSEFEARMTEEDMLKIISEPPKTERTHFVYARPAQKPR